MVLVGASDAMCVSPNGRPSSSAPPEAAQGIWPCYSGLLLLSSKSRCVRKKASTAALNSLWNAIRTWAPALSCSQCGHQARDHGDKQRPPPHDHSITSSAWTSTAGGIVSPSALAVVRLTTSSNFVGCWIGRSPGFAPFRILSTRSADRRQTSAMLGPWLASPPAAANPLSADNTGSRYLRDRSAMALGFA